ncbi:MAG: tRNA modification GTPase MnmE [Firmicutes bacterium]|nr:tRNA modification GTPase MnmE [candidate division NPL-UPA2 bacterium]
MNKVPQAVRPHIVILGRCNVGKSTLINALCEQSVALVSAQPGTTTDPVAKSMELLPYGPVVLVDTAGLDDDTPLGKERVKLSERALRKADLALLVVETHALHPLEQDILARLRKRRIHSLVVINCHGEPSGEAGEHSESHAIEVNALTGQGVRELRERIAAVLQSTYEELPLVRDLLTGKGPVVLVTPIDKAAPKGRLILPQVQVLRDILDGGGVAVVCRETELAAALSKLNSPPELVVTDSQVFPEVARLLPKDASLTSFSILMARNKGDLPALVQGAEAIAELRPLDRVLIVEGCTHHSQEDDIGRVKIPRLLEGRAGGELRFTWAKGPNFTADIHDYRLIVHCGACMLNRREMLARLEQAAQVGVPVVNYGVLLAHFSGILERSLAPVLPSLSDTVFPPAAITYNR